MDRVMEEVGKLLEHYEGSVTITPEFMMIANANMLPCRRVGIIEKRVKKGCYLTLQLRSDGRYRFEVYESSHEILGGWSSIYDNPEDVFKAVKRGLEEWCFVEKKEEQLSLL